MKRFFFLLVIAMFFVGCGMPPEVINPPDDKKPPVTSPEVKTGFLVSEISQPVKLVEKLSGKDLYKKVKPVEYTLSPKRKLQVKAAQFIVKSNKPGFINYLDILVEWEQKTIQAKAGEETKVLLKGLEIDLPEIFENGLFVQTYNSETRKKANNRKVLSLGVTNNRLNIFVCGGKADITKVNHSTKVYNIKIDDDDAVGSGTIEWSDDHDGYIVSMLFKRKENNEEFWCENILTDRTKY